MRIRVLLFSFLLASTAVFAQNTVQNRQNWFSYFAQFKLSPNWGIHTDVQLRMDEEVAFSAQNLLRAGLMRYLQPNAHLALGYAFINTRNAGFNAYATEHRIWQQFGLTQNFNNLNVGHRLRLEQRFVERLVQLENEKIDTDGFNNGNRFRYFNRTIYTFNKRPETLNKFYLAFQNEVFLNFASRNLNRNIFDQNRFYAGFGIAREKHTRLELGYMNQFITPYNRANVMNHIVQVSVLQVLDFSRPVPVAEPLP